MGKSDAQFLQTLERTSRQKQDAFMSQIAKRLGRSPGAEPAPHHFQGAPDFWREHELQLEERIELFMSNWRKAGGEAQHFSSMKEAERYILDTVRSMQAKRFVRQDQPLLETLKLEEQLSGAEVTVWDTKDSDELVRKAAEADIGLSVADYAVAVTGSLVLMSGAGQGRTVSLLPTAFMAIIPASVLKTRLGEVMHEIRSNHKGNMPAGIHFVSGPSRSADIENDLTIGVHGPGIVYAIIVDD